MEVPDGRYCWQHIPPHEICEYFDNEGGCPSCDKGLDEEFLKRTNKGVLKSTKCLSLQKGEKWKDCKTGI